MALEKFVSPQITMKVKINILPKANNIEGVPMSIGFLVT